MTHTAPIFVYMEFGYDWGSADYEKKWRPSVKGYKAENTDELVYVGQQSVADCYPESGYGVDAAGTFGG